MYGDPAHPVLLSPYDGDGSSPAQMEFNKRMSSCHEAVELGLADVSWLWEGFEFSFVSTIISFPHWGSVPGCGTVNKHQHMYLWL